MKSLEIVNREIANLDEDDLWTNGKLNIIKQDLEVLEELKSRILKAVDIGEFYKIREWLEDNENDRKGSN